MISELPIIQNHHDSKNRPKMMINWGFDLIVDKSNLNDMLVSDQVFKANDPFLYIVKQRSF